MCQRGGVSNKPPGLQAVNGPYTGPVLLRQGDPGTSQYIDINILMIYSYCQGLHFRKVLVPLMPSCLPKLNPSLLSILCDFRPDMFHQMISLSLCISEC